jgi:hypothetical protein
MLYVYCLSDEVTARMIEGAKGVGEAEPRLLQCGAIAAVVSDFAGETIAPTRENVFAHERVVGRVLAEITPLPLRFGTLVGAEQLQSYVASQMSLLEAALKRVRGAVEMSVKIIRNVEDALSEAPKDDATAENHKSLAAAGAGTKFLLEKQRQISFDERLKTQAEEIAAWLEASLSDVVKETFVQMHPAEKLVVAASHLVERKLLDIYRTRVETARRERQDLHFLTSGPWSPYSFSNLPK